MNGTNIIVSEQQKTKINKYKNKMPRLRAGCRQNSVFKGSVIKICLPYKLNLISALY